jgi:protein involved in polysaccharide export with SLBB domain
MTLSRMHAVKRVSVGVLSLCTLTLQAQAQTGPESLVGTSTTSLSGFSSGSGMRLDANLPAMPVIRQGAGQTPGGGADDPLRGLATSTLASPPKALPPNDFQRFVLEATGQALPLFGAGFFSQPQTPFTAQGNTPVSPDYRIGPGDELQIRGWGSVDVDVRTSVDRNGQIHIPRVGSVSLSGIRSAQAEDVVRAAIGKYYRDFQISVTLGQLKGLTIYVVGQARKPGAYTLSSSSTLVSALFASGGPNQTGSMRHVQVKRGDKLITELDLYAFLAKGDKAADVRLQDGDTIVIPPAKGYVALSGKVGTPAVYELSGDGESLGSMLALAGGLSVVADPKRAQLERLDPTRMPARSVDVFALDAKGLATPLRNGDMLNVSPLMPEFGNAITLRGNVSEPVRTPWRDGIKVRDLIPSRAYLMSRASVKRQNETLLSEDDKLRASSATFGEDEAKKPAALEPRKVGDNVDTLAQRIGSLIDEVNMEYAVVERVDANKLTVALLPFNLGKALDDANSPDNLPLQPGDVVTVFSVNDVRVPQAKRQVFVRVEGEVRRPGIYQMSPGDSLPQLLDKAGGLTEDAYLFGAAFYRDEVRQAQLANLNQLVRRLEMQTQTRLSASAASVTGAGAEGGAAQMRLQAEAQAQKQALDRLRNLNPTGRIMLGLEPGVSEPGKLPTLALQSRDRLVIPTRPDFVYVLGSVNTESSLIWQPGKTVDHYLNVSGLTSGADKDELFVIRADGSVVSDAARAWFSSVTSEVVQPGDVIVLPEKTDHESGWSVFTRNAKDITQIIYQFSLGAAAIKTLRE